MLESPDAETAAGSRTRHHGHWVWRVGDWRRQLALRLGAARRRRLGRDDSTRARPRHQLGGHRRRLRAGHPEQVVAHALAEIPAGRRPTSSRSRAWSGTRTARSRTVAGRFDPSRGRGQPAAAWRGGHRPLPDSLAPWGSSPAGWDPGSIEEGWHAMADLQKAGKVRYIGASNFTGRPTRANAVARSRACSRPTRCSARNRGRPVPWCLGTAPA